MRFKEEYEENENGQDTSGHNTKIRCTVKRRDLCIFFMTTAAIEWLYQS